MRYPFYSALGYVGMLCVSGILGMTACKTTTTTASEPREVATVSEKKKEVVEFKPEIIEAPDDIYDHAELMSPIYFGFDDAFLDDADKAMLDKVVAWMREHPDTAFVIEGHSDLEGTYDYNEELGLARARQIHDYLLSAGISDERLQIVSRGETAPAVLTSNGVRHWRNRRVEFEVSRVPAMGGM